MYYFYLQNPYDSNMRRSTIDNKFNFNGKEELTTEAVATHDSVMLANSRDSTLLMGANAPDLPPRIDRTSKPPSTNITPSSTLLTTTSALSALGMATNGNRNGSFNRSAHGQLFGDAATASSLTATLADATAPIYDDEYSTRINPSTPDKRGSLNASSLERKQGAQLLNEKALRSSTSTNPAIGRTNSSAYDSISSYDSCNAAMQNLRLGPNAPDDLKSVPSVA